MKQSDFSPQFGVLWAAQATSTTLQYPLLSGTSLVTGRASIATGFTSVNFTPPAAGGVYPYGSDWNGALRTLSVSAQNYEGGVIPTFSSEFATDIGGYASGAIVADAGTPGLYWRSTVDNNTTTPGASGASWVAIITDTALLQWELITSSTTITLPAWAHGFEIKAIAGGGSGAYCYSSGTTQVSGGGGGAGGFAWGVYYPGSGTSLTLSIGAQGGNTTVAWNGSTNISCYGGGNSAWPTNWSSPGGDGGAAGGGNIMNVTGGRGNDGMAGTSASGQIAYNIGARGSSSQFGEGGRAGQGGGADAAGYGAGGGGAYDLTGSATVRNGGAGMQGCILIRFIP